MTFVATNSYDVEKAADYFRKLIGKGATFSITEHRPGRSNRQNNYLHLILGFFGATYGCSIDEAKVDFYKRQCNRDIYERTRVNQNGREVRYLRSSRELDTGEMNLSIERFRNWSAAEAGIYLPAPNEEQFLVYCQQVIERNQEFL